MIGVVRDEESGGWADMVVTYEDYVGVGLEIESRELVSSFKRDIVSSTDTRRVQLLLDYYASKLEEVVEWCGGVSGAARPDLLSRASQSALTGLIRELVGWE